MKLARAVSLAFLTLGSPPALAQQFTVVDVTYTHSTETARNSEFYVRTSAQAPANWRAPVDYASGTLHVYMEVQTKPTAEKTVWNFCFLGSPSYSCGWSGSYTATGKYTWRQSFSTFHQYRSVDWTRRPGQVEFILKDTSNHRPAPDKVALFMPTRVRVVLTVVAPGAVYMGPTGVDGGTAPDAARAGPEAGARDATGVSPLPDGAEDEAALVPPAPAPQSRPDAAVAAEVDDPAAKPDRRSEPAIEGGCSVGRGPPGWWGLAMVLALVLTVQRARRT